MLKIPYGLKQVDVNIEKGEILDGDKSKKGINKNKKEKDVEIIKKAIKKPINAKRLRDLTEEKNGGKIVIVVDDHTREVPVEQMLDYIVEEIGEDKKENCTVLVACGSHPSPTEKELKRVIGKHYPEFSIKVHNCDAKDLVYLGETSRGTPVILNKDYVEADIRIITGDITLHYYAGFGGGRKSILPGLSSRATIKKNHAFLVDENAQTAKIENNPVHLDMCEAASFALPDFTINTIADTDGNIIEAYAGEMNSVFYNGVIFAKKIFLQRTTEMYDILIVSAGGFPKDRTLYHATKAIEHCYRALMPGGRLILVAECSGGIGDEFFEEWMNKYDDYEEVEKEIRKNFMLGGHKAFYMKKAMKRNRLSIVSELDDNMLKEWGINAYSTVNEAIEEELKKTKSSVDGNNIKVGIIKNGLDVLLMPKKKL